MNLLALCRPSDAALVIKRVQITQPVQETIGGLFQQQATEFLDGVEEEVPFGGDWKPDTDEILTVDAPNEIASMYAALSDPISLETIPAAMFGSESIKGLFTGSADNSRIYIQAFTTQQILARTRLALILDGDVFRQVTEPSFTLDNKLVAIAEGGQLKFKRFNLIKRIFALDEVYQVASDQEIDTFCAHASLSVVDIQAFKQAADQVIRKLVHAVGTSNILDQCAVTDIQNKAGESGVSLSVQDGKIIVPTERARLKELLRFLDDSIYQGPVSSRRLITNSKRAFSTQS
jgi:hypothetical protein